MNKILVLFTLQIYKKFLKCIEKSSIFFDFCLIFLLTHVFNRKKVYICTMKYVFLAIFFLMSTTMMGGNKIYSPDIKTLTSTVNGDWLNRPVMTLGSNQQLLIGFDELSHDYRRLVYRIEHCEADWTVSEELFESDWLAGFNNNPIEDYQNSINTTQLYTHYRLTIPNDKCRLKMSGNYRLSVYDEDNADERLLEVEFYVVEPLLNVGLEVTTNTDIDHNVSHQQLSVTVDYRNLRITDTEEELRTVFMQNWREDNARVNMKPSFVNSRELTWSHQRQLIFDAGNEFHKYEVLDVSHPTMGIDRIEWDGHNYQVWPFATTERRNYLTDVDADGAFVIRNSDRTEVDYTCEYVMVNYCYVVPYDGDLFVSGHWTNDTRPDAYRMEYDEQQKAYTLSLLQKQGYYSYQYLKADGTSPKTEGSFYQTENRYQVLVYHKAPGQRTWRLVGYRCAEMR